MGIIQVTWLFYRCNNERKQRRKRHIDEILLSINFKINFTYEPLGKQELIDWLIVSASRGPSRQVSFLKLKAEIILTTKPSSKITVTMGAEFQKTTRSYSRVIRRALRSAKWRICWLSGAWLSLIRQWRRRTLSNCQLPSSPADTLHYRCLFTAARWQPITTTRTLRAPSTCSSAPRPLLPAVNVKQCWHLAYNDESWILHRDSRLDISQFLYPFTHHCTAISSWCFINLYYTGVTKPQRRGHNSEATGVLPSLAWLTTDLCLSR